MRQGTAAIIARTIEYAGLAALVGGAFPGVVVGAGLVLGLEVPHAGLTFAAALLLAFAFEPARRRLHRLASRVVYGHRQSPQEAVSRLASQIGGGRDPEDLLGELTRVIRAGIGASLVVVWLRDGRTWTPAATSPGTAAEPTAAAGDTLPHIDGTDLTLPVRHGGDLLGALSVGKAATGSLNPLERRLLSDLATHAGIVIRTLQLRRRLWRRLAHSRQQQQRLIASRVEVVTTHDAERRRLERDIHDSCQQPAVVLAGRLGLAGAVAHRDPEYARATLEEAYADLQRLTAALGRLTNPSPLPEPVAEGIAAGLRTSVASLPVPIEVDNRITRRHRAEVEAAVYFCCLEAIQNAVKHARATRIRVRLSDDRGAVSFQVCDDGIGFATDQPSTGVGLANMRERLRQVGAHLVTRTSPAGTEIGADIPVPQETAS